MPLYELSLVMKVIPRVELSAALKRVGMLLLDKGAIVHKLENHGTRDLPYKFNIENEVYYKGNYFVYHFLSTPNIFSEIGEIYERDVDILRHYFGTSYKDLPHGCTLHEEMKPPAQRESIQILLEKSKKNKDRTKPYDKRVKTFNYYDIYM